MMAESTAAIPQLPLDLIVSILFFLPAKTLFKLCSVCKSWNYLIKKDRFFAIRHINARNNPNKPAIANLTKAFRFNDYFDGGDYVLNYGYGSNLCRISTFFAEEFPYAMTGSCDGLVGVYSCDSFWLANPSIGRATELPRGSPHCHRVRSIPTAAIGYEYLTGDYQVVRLFHREDGSIGCEIFSLNKGSWRLVEDDPPRLSYQLMPLPFVVNRFMYWTVGYMILRTIKTKGGRKNVMRSEVGVCFDMREEKFSVLMHPMSERVNRRSRLVSLGGYVCLSDTGDGPQMTIWRLVDNSKSEWVKQYEIDMRKMENYDPFKRDYSLLMPLTMDNGKIVLYGHHGWRSYYDPVTMKFVGHEKIDNVLFDCAAPCVESVVCPY